MFKKFFSVLTVVVVAFCFSFTTSHASNGVNPDGDESLTDFWESVLESGTVDANDIKVDKNQIQMAENLSNYFEEDVDGNINFTANKETLMQMGIPESDAELMTSISSDSSDRLNIIEGEQQLQGFVGLHLKLGPRVRAMSSVIAGAFAAGYVGWHVKKIATKGPWGAGAAAAITAATGGVVGYAVKKGLKKVDIGVNIPFVSLSYTVNIP